MAGQRRCGRARPKTPRGRVSPPPWGGRAIPRRGDYGPPGAGTLALRWPHARQPARPPHAPSLAIDAAIAVAVFAASLGLLAAGERTPTARSTPSASCSWRSRRCRWSRAGAAPIAVFASPPREHRRWRPSRSPPAPARPDARDLLDGRRQRRVACPTRLMARSSWRCWSPHAAANGFDEAASRYAELLFGVLVWGGAWLAGDRTRLRHERMAELEERALRAEREAERERRLAAAEERTRIARDLHDSAGHAINVILVHAGARAPATERDPQAAREAFETIEEVARETIGEIDQIVARAARRRHGRGGRGAAARARVARRARRAPPRRRARRHGRRARGRRARCRRPSTEAPTASCRRRSPTRPGTATAAQAWRSSPARRARADGREPGAPRPAGARRPAVGTASSGCASARPFSAAALEAGLARRALPGARAAARSRGTGHERGAGASADRRRRRPDARRPARRALERRRDRGRRRGRRRARRRCTGPGCCSPTSCSWTCACPTWTASPPRASSSPTSPR